MSHYISKLNFSLLLVQTFAPTQHLTYLKWKYQDHINHDDISWFYIGLGNFAFNHNGLVVYAKAWLRLSWQRWLNLNDWNAKWCVGTNFIL